MRTHQGSARDDRGQVAVEFLGMVPLILLTLALLWQVVLVGYAFTLAGNAADEAARACAVGDDGPAAAGRHIGGAWSASGGDCDRGGGMVHVRVSVEVPVLVPGLGGLFPVVGEAGAVDEEGLTP
ncbi:TadE/TadG family type IV pilus assembly protein [Streptomyces sp. NPDC006553]|uniref:TadE/TadG family type IV pilus assembly protein n=1 Tax=unclassified Streptomyces TaxID=2593676 RepID=UPI00225935C8|nr:TadE/TadG family type IV pilus assembly protein [Streptomyces sp. NBC_00233]MCX5228367.1 pilus assembly protein [Streptomyces sp. NBC_00233]